MDNNTFSSIGGADGVATITRESSNSTEYDQVINTYKVSENETQTNYNKPWRQIIRRIVSDG